MSSALVWMGLVGTLFFGGRQLLLWIRDKNRPILKWVLFLTLLIGIGVTVQTDDASAPLNLVGTLLTFSALAVLLGVGLRDLVGPTRRSAAG